MTGNVELTVNGEQHQVEVSDNALLVDVLREQLGLTGTHVGCDTSQCGACTVHVDGRSVKSCTILAVQADGAEVVTALVIPIDQAMARVVDEYGASGRR